MAKYEELREVVDPLHSIFFSLNDARTALDSDYSDKEKAERVLKALREIESVARSAAEGVESLEA